tara:strand:+ start:1002 stop:1322 length:321 start_codon:yes stop_codon:yes gene_type:complete
MSTWLQSESLNGRLAVKQEPINIEVQFGGMVGKLNWVKLGQYPKISFSTTDIERSIELLKEIPTYAIITNGTVQHKVSSDGMAWSIRLDFVGNTANILWGNLDEKN